MCGHRHVLSRLQYLEQARRLGAIARAQVDQYRTRSDCRRHLITIGGEDTGLGAGRIVFLQVTDGLEELAAQGIVEVLGGNGSLRRRQGADELAAGKLVVRGGLPAGGKGKGEWDQAYLLAVAAVDGCGSCLLTSTRGGVATVAGPPAQAIGRKQHCPAADAPPPLAGGQAAYAPSAYTDASSDQDHIGWFNTATRFSLRQHPLPDDNPAHRHVFHSKLID